MRTLLTILCVVLAATGSHAAHRSAERPWSEYKPVTYKYLAEHCENPPSGHVLIRSVQLKSSCQFTPGDWAWLITACEPATSTPEVTFFVIITRSKLGELLRARLGRTGPSIVNLYLSMADTGVGSCLNDGTLERLDFLDAQGQVVETIVR